MTSLTASHLQMEGGFCKKAIPWVTPPPSISRPISTAKSMTTAMKGGGMTFIPLSSNSSKGVGESINLETAKILTISKHGDDDHMEVED